MDSLSRGMLQINGIHPCTSTDDEGQFRTGINGGGAHFGGAHNEDISVSNGTWQIVSTQDGSKRIEAPGP